MKIILHLALTILLTILTQIGGFVYLLTLFLSRNKSTFNSLNRFGLFVLLYLVATFMLTPVIARQFGRERIKQSKLVKPVTFLTNLCNRNYVRPELNELIQKVAVGLQKQYPNLQTQYLDANFPFINGFPLLPHLSHSDGKKLDLAFVYEDDDKKVSNKKKSLTGYGVFEAPLKGETKTTDQCQAKGYTQYDYNKFLGFSVNKQLSFSEKGTKAIIDFLLKENQLEKIFIEPHLKTRLRLNHKKIRFHGCQAVRHDDHIHIQIK